jgi:hypothetical protein
MALKKFLTDKEQFGLTEEEIGMAQRYLRKYKTAGIVPQQEQPKLYELLMVGCSFVEIQQHFPQYTLSQIILTAAIKGWLHDREKMMSSLKDRVQAKVVKSVIDQVDFLTTMMAVVNTEHIEEMKKFVADPKNNPAPSIRIQNIKEYKETAEILLKLVTSANTANNKGSVMFETLNPAKQKALHQLQKEKQQKHLQNAMQEDDVALLIASEVEK